MPDKPFRTLEMSDPRFERDGLRTVTVKTPHLRGRGDLTVWIPPSLSGTGSPEPLPLVILLHGVYGSHWAWAGKAGVHHTAARLIGDGRMPPVVLAMPSDGLWGDGSGYLPHDGRAFDRWIVDDVPRAVAAVTPLVSVALPVYLAGLSMGGYGALRLAATYSARFRAAYGLSSITELGQMSQFVEEPLANYRQAAPTDESVLASLLRNRDRLPRIGFCCGTDDQLIEPNRMLHQALTGHGIPHTYHEHSGGHEWSYWETHIADALVFLTQ